MKLWSGWPKLWLRVAFPSLIKAVIGLVKAFPRLGKALILLLAASIFLSIHFLPYSPQTTLTEHTLNKYNINTLTELNLQ